jgi:hypothetical protein
MGSVKDAIASMVQNIEDKTGKTVTEWVRLARGSGFDRHGEILKWLKETHGVGHGYANFIAKQALQADETGEDDLVAAQFAGPKAALKPLYEQLIAVVQAFGSDVEIAPKKNNVSIRRSKQFALLQASTATRLDVGLILKGVEPAGRLEAAGSFNAMFTHRVKLAAAKDIDGELKGWLKQAYAAA